VVEERPIQVNTLSVMLVSCQIKSQNREQERREIGPKINKKWTGGAGDNCLAISSLIGKAGVLVFL
jgi:hypothetical protein